MATVNQVVGEGETGYVFTGYRVRSAADEPVVEFSRADGRADVVYPEGAAAGSRLGGNVLSIQARTAECR